MENSEKELFFRRTDLEVKSPQVKAFI